MLTYFDYNGNAKTVRLIDEIHYLQYVPVVLSNRQTLMKRVVEQNQTDSVRLQEKSINLVQK